MGIVARSVVYLARLRAATSHRPKRGIRIGRASSIAPSAIFLCVDGGSIELGDGVHLGPNTVTIVRGGHLRLGSNSSAAFGTVISALESVSIGNDVLIAEYVTIRDQDHIHDTGEVIRKAGFRTSPIVIGDNVWIGAKATVTRGVTIGDGSVVAANCVVTTDVPAGTVFGGVPGRVLKTIG